MSPVGPALFEERSSFLKKNGFVENSAGNQGELRG
jgi:hypothetical protein